jgi:ACS family hexuronate transporter-like MFS transporter
VGAAIFWWTSDRAPSAPQTKAGGSTPARPGWREAVRLIFSQRPLRALIFARIVSDPFYFFLNNWHTGFLQEHAGWSLQAIARLTWIPWVFVPLASMGVAAWSDHRARATGDPAGARRAALCGLALLAPAAAMAPFLADTGPVVLGLVTLSLAMTSCWVTLSGVMVSELAPAGTIATTIGILSALSGCASIAFNQAAGFLVDAFGYTALFVAGACLHPIAAFILWRSQQVGAAVTALPARIGSLGTS